jgi:hypothetical protein
MEPPGRQASPQQWRSPDVALRRTQRTTPTGLAPPVAPHLVAVPPVLPPSRCGTKSARESHRLGSELPCSVLRLQHHLRLVAASALVVADGLLRLTFRGRATPEHSPLWLFDATREASVPTWFTIATMAWLGIECMRRQALGACRFVIGAGFVFLALDDALMLHERLGDAVAPHVASELVYHWVLVLAPVFALGGLVVAWLVWRALEPWPARRRWLVAGMAALGTALLLEAFEAATSRSAIHLRGIHLLDWSKWVEESLEVVAPSVLLMALPPRRPAARLVEGRTSGAGVSSSGQHDHPSAATFLRRRR